MAAKPPGGTGAATAPTAMLGSQQAGMTQVKLGLEALQKSLSSIPMGSDLHTEILTALSKIGKLLAKDGTGSDSNSIVQQLALLARDAKAQPQQQAALSNIMSGAGAAPPAGGAAVPPMAA
jgi:hypothetical protein